MGNLYRVIMHSKCYRPYGAGTSPISQELPVGDNYRDDVHITTPRRPTQTNLIPTTSALGRERQLIMRSSIVLAYAAAVAQALTLKTTPRDIAAKLVCLLPSWVISDLKVHYSDDSFVPGNATFTLFSSIANATEDVTCEVPFNYICRMPKGTPGNKDINLEIIFGPDSAEAQLNQSWVCADTPGTPTT